MNLMQREDELDRVISDALHEIADNLYNKNGGFYYS